MAVIRATDSEKGRKYQVIVRKGGHSLSRVFWRQREAESWARGVEDAISHSRPDMPFDRNKWLGIADPPQAEVEDSKPHVGWTLDRALQEYAKTVTPSKKGAEQEQRRVSQWRARDLAKKRLDEVTTDDLTALKDERLAAGRSGSTVNMPIKSGNCRC